MELADCRIYCAEGVAESEALGDQEMLAEFMVQGALLDIMEGRTDSTTQAYLAVSRKQPQLHFFIFFPYHTTYSVDAVS